MSLSTAQIKQLYQQQGAEFLLPAAALAQKLEGVRAFVFDWDGVFNDGSKSTDLSSGWNESDATGINLLRFAGWLQHGKLLPVIIITGEKNPATIRLARRDRYDAVFFGMKNKMDAISTLSRKDWNLKPDSVSFVFDDVIDLPVAAHARVRFLVRRQSSLLLAEHVRENNLADYISYSPGGAAIREIAELWLSLTGMFGKVIRKRGAFDESYQQFIHERNLTETLFYTREHGKTVKINLPILED